jgi:hypothetical protein
LLSAVALGASKIGQKSFAESATGFGSFETGYVSSYDRMILDKMNRTHPY